MGGRQLGQLGTTLARCAASTGWRRGTRAARPRDFRNKVIHPWRNTRLFSCFPGIRLVRPALSGLAWRWKAKCPMPSRCHPVFPRDVGGYAPTPSRLSALLSALASRLSARLSGQTRCFSAHLSRLSGYVANRKGATERDQTQLARNDWGKNSGTIPGNKKNKKDNKTSGEQNRQTIPTIF